MTERPDPLAEPEGYGSRIPASLRHLAGPGAVGHGRATEIFPYRENTLGAATTPGDETGRDGICTWTDPGTDVRCGKEREWVLLLGDINEHVTPLDLCDRHMVTVARVPRFWCTLCRQDMKLEKVGANSSDGELIWLDESGWPATLQPNRNKPPERLF